jgi:hypothetical protein
MLAALAARSALAAYNPKLAIGAGGLTLAASNKRSPRQGDARRNAESCEGIA